MSDPQTAWVIGRGGQLARALAAARWPASWSVRFLSRAEGADLDRPERLADMIHERRPGLVFNAAAYTAVDRAEEEEDEAHRINGHAPGVIARACREADAIFVHVSTDYVFDGRGERPWRPDDPTAPLNAYGRTKAAGERAVAASAGHWAVLRTSWVYDAAAKNFFTTMLRLAEDKDEIRVVADQVGAPTYAPDLAEGLIRVGVAMSRDAGLGGVHHLVGDGDVSWAGFARAIFEARGKRGLRAPRVIDISSEAWPTPARRPKNSRLCMKTLDDEFGFRPRSWRMGLDDAMDAVSSDPST